VDRVLSKPPKLRELRAALTRSGQGIAAPVEMADPAKRVGSAG